MPRLRVWVVTPEIHRQGGTEYSIAEQVERWRSQFDLRLYTMRADGVDLDGVTLRKIPTPPGPHLLRYLWWFAAGRALRWSDSRRLGFPDVLYSPGINAPESMAMSVHILFAKFWERVRGRIVSDLLRSGSAPRALHRILYWRLLRALERRAYSGPATLWAISTEDARELEARLGRPPGTVPVVPHGVDARWFSPDARAAARPLARKRLGVDGARVVLAVGNDAYKKGFDVALQSLAFLPGDVVLALAGSADPGPARAWARGADVEDRVHLWPHTSNILDYYAAADVFVAPSREDAFHLPVMEALACGLPAIVSTRAGAAELLEDGRHVYLLSDPEDAEALARAVGRIFDDPAIAQTLSAEGRRLAEALTWEANAERTGALIEREARNPRVIVLATDPGGVGGIQRATRSLIEVLAKSFGAERIGLVSVWRSERESPLQCRLLYSGWKRKVRTRVRLVNRAAYLLAAIRAARRWRVRLVVVAAHPHLAPVARACRALLGIPYVVWCFGEEVWGALRPSVRRALVEADGVFAPSDFTARRVEEAAGLRRRSVRVIPLCLSPEMAPAPASTKRSKQVVSVARLTPEHAYKGVDLLLRAWPDVLRKVPDAELVVVGDGPDRVRLEEIRRTLGLDGNVRLVGHLEDRELLDLYASSRVFALPSRARLAPKPEGEGFGLVFVEAGAAGLPVVAGRSGAVPEVVADGETGILVDPDDPSELAAAIVRLLTDNDLAQRLGEAARARALSEYSFERFQTEVSELVTEVGRRRYPTLDF